MKNTIKTLVILFSVAIIFYLLACFYSSSFNPINMDHSSKGVFIGLFVMSCFVIFMVKFLTDDES